MTIRASSPGSGTKEQIKSASLGVWVGKISRNVELAMKMRVRDIVVGTVPDEVEARV